LQPSPNANDKPPAQEVPTLPTLNIRRSAVAQRHLFEKKRDRSMRRFTNANKTSGKVTQGHSMRGSINANKTSGKATQYEDQEMQTRRPLNAKIDKAAASANERIRRRGTRVQSAWNKSSNNDKTRPQHWSTNA
ncbi:hypothetical protein TUN199_06431, partial [Pyrenophora tritici-repentis]